MSGEKQLGIQITLTLDDEELIHRTSSSFETAEMNLDSIKRWWEKKQQEQEAEAELAEEEN